MIDFGFVAESKGATPGLMRQVHGAALVELRAPGDRERHLQSPSEADGALAFLPDTEVHVFTADCIPVLLHSAHAVAAVHAGWRGALAGITARAVERLGGPGGLTAVLGPSILGCCFEVREDFVAAFRASAYAIDPFVEKRGGKLYCHLARFVMETQLVGVTVDTRELRCTFCSTPRLPSYRRNGSTDVRLRAWIVRRSVARRLNPR